MCMSSLNTAVQIDEVPGPFSLFQCRGRIGAFPSLINNCWLLMCAHIKDFTELSSAH